MRALFTLFLFLSASAPPASAYSVLTHEAIIDASWEPVIVPALRQRFPSTTADTLHACRAYAYGGAIMPDMGYFPRESRLFSDLLHYVRTGDFVTALADSANTPQEYAFALGALAHYTADRYGHPLGVNKVVPLLFPKLASAYGHRVTYEDDRTAHTRTEFGFDVLQTARGNYSPGAYRQFISFQIADGLLRRAFRTTYGLDLDDLFEDFERSVRTFRWAVREVFPQLTRQAWKSRQNEIRAVRPTATARAFSYRMRRDDFQTAFGRGIDRPGFRARATAGVLRFLPKVGPFKVLKPVIPNADGEKLFILSFDTVLKKYQQVVVARRERPLLLNVNYDTGEPDKRGAYQLADDTYDAYLLRLLGNGWKGVTRALKVHLLSYYAEPANPAADSTLDNEIQKALDGLRHVPPRSRQI